jgi:hypothetical protein
VVGVISTLLLLAPCTANAAQADGEYWITDFSRHTVPLEEIVSGGPPKDGIPAIDHPSFEDVKGADEWLDDREPVAVVTIEGETHAYPLQVLIWHEIVNDEVGGVPVTVTFCPLCNTTLAFNRALDGEILDFGTTGRLRHSDLIMYDRQTESWWQQATGEGIIGHYAGRKLTFIPAPVLRWKDVKEQTPDASVVSKDTGFRRSYGHNPYEGYDGGGYPGLGYGQISDDKRLPAMERVVALDRGDPPMAIPFKVIREKRVMSVRAGGEDLVTIWAPGTASAIDAKEIAWGREVGSTAVFSATLDGRLLRFSSYADGLFKDWQTGSTWNMSGQAVEGPLQGKRLEAIPHGNHFWFAWIAFKPETELITGGS